MIALVVAGVLACEPGEVEAIATRLAGQTFTVAADRRSIDITDVAGEGAPMVGTVAREGASLFLVTSDGQYELRGPLARPRIAGPGYTVWVIGDLRDGAVTVRRLGVLRRPVR